MEDAVSYSGENNKEIIGGIFGKVLKKYTNKVEKAFNNNLPSDEREKELYERYCAFKKINFKNN